MSHLPDTNRIAASTVIAVNVPGVTLSSTTATMPIVGLGLGRMPRPVTPGVVTTALELGYRHFDTSQKYHNERQLGDAMRASGIPRDEVFLTTKLHPAHHAPGATRRSFAASLDRLGVDRVDLFMFHNPSPFQPGDEFVKTWQVLEGFVADGRATAIGVSNFEPWRLEVLAQRCQVWPAVNQVEVHPYFRNPITTRYSSDRDITVVAWSPLARGRVLTDPVVTDIAGRMDCTPAQVVLAWHLQSGRVVIPMSTVREELEQNITAVDVHLTDDDLAALDGLDRGEPGRLGRHPDNLPRPSLQDRVRLRSRLRLIRGSD